MIAIRKLIETMDSFKFLANGRIIVSGEWLLIQAEDRIVTLYKGDERNIVRQKVWGKNDSKKPTARRRGKPSSR
jgi:hypothetical protein